MKPSHWLVLLAVTVIFLALFHPLKTVAVLALVCSAAYLSWRLRRG